jgi:hypothetical protein
MANVLKDEKKQQAGLRKRCGRVNKFESFMLSAHGPAAHP